MNKEDFLVNFAEQFDDTDPSEIKMDTRFHELEEWSSLIGMSVIAMAKTQYSKTVTGKDIRDCITVEDLFNLISSK